MRTPTSPYSLAAIGTAFTAAGLFVIATADPKTVASDHYSLFILSVVFVLLGVQLVAIAFFKRVAKVFDAIFFFPIIVGFLWAAFTPLIHYSHPYIVRSGVIVLVVFLLADAGRKLRKKRREQDA